MDTHRLIRWTLVALVLLCASPVSAVEDGCEAVIPGGVGSGDPESLPPVGRQHVAVLMTIVDGRQPVTSAEDMSAMFTTKIAPYYAEVSRGRIEVTHEIHGPASLPSRCDDFFGACQDLIDTLDPVVDFRTVAAVFGAGAYECGWAGTGLVGSTTWQTDDGPVVLSCSMNRSQYGPDTTAQIGTHELGHNFGSHHSGCCLSATPTERRQCGEYFNDFSVMGSATLMGHWDAVQKAHSGFVALEEVLVVTTSGRYTIGVHEPPTVGPRLLRLRMTGDPLADLLIEARTPYGFDAFPAQFHPGMDDGALLQVLDPFNPHPAKPMIFDPLPVSCTGLLCNCDDPALKPGESFTHPHTGWTVTTVARDETSLVVDVVVPGVPTTTVTMSSTSSTSTSTSTSTTVSTTSSTVTTTTLPGCRLDRPNRGKLRGCRRRFGHGE